MLGSLRCHKDDENENVKKAVSWIGKTKTLHVLYTFLDISLPSLHDYDLKIPDMYFHITLIYRDMNQQQRNYLSFPELGNNS